MEVLKLLKAGVPIDDVAKKFGLSPGYIRVVIRDPHIKRVRKPWNKANAKKYTDEQREQNLKDARDKFDEWRAKHLKTCADLPGGECCPSCHDDQGLYLLEVKGMCWYICCEKLHANYEKLGYKTKTILYSHATCF
jgi:hypothetical protein